MNSSLISTIAQNHSKNKIKTFSMCFENEDYNEQKFSKSVADHINSDHKEEFVTSTDMFKLYEDLPDIYDEPFADSSQLPTILLSKFASQNVKVCLTGDGADELFGGYNRYLFINKIFSKTKYIPQSILNICSKLILNVEYKNLDYFINKIFKVF